MIATSCRVGAKAKFECGPWSEVNLPFSDRYLSANGQLIEV